MKNIDYQRIIDKQIEKFKDSSKRYLNNFYFRNGITKDFDYDFLCFYSNDEKVFLTEYKYIKQLIQEELIENLIKKLLEYDGINYIDQTKDDDLVNSNVDLILVDKKESYGFSVKQNNTNESMQKMGVVFKKYSKYKYINIDLKKQSNNIFEEDYNKLSFCGMLENIFPEIDSKQTISKIEESIEEVKHLIGLNVMPQYSKRYINYFKDDVLAKFINKDNDYYISEYYISNPRKNNKNKTQIEDTANLLANNPTIIGNFYNKKMYKVLITNSDFSKCFLTSEYLFNNYKDNENFDYINIASGYIKSIEILLYKIKVHFFHEDDFDLKRTMGDYVDIISNQKFRLFKLNCEKDYVVACDCLFFYMIKIRNEFFHKNLVDTWEKVKNIRNNTLYLYYLLLGALDLKESFKEEMEVKDNDFEELYKAVLLHNKNRLYFVKDGKETIAISPRGENYIIDYDKNGSFYNPSFDLFIIDDNTETKTIDDYLKIKEKNNRITISSLNLPDYVYIDKDKKIIIWSKE